MFDRNPFAAHFISGLLAETLSCMLWVPIDVVKERLQVQSNASSGVGKYKGNIHAVKTILRTEGFRGVYKGYGATVASFGPFSALYFMFYEKLKALSPRVWKVEDSSQLPFESALLSGAVAGGMASLLTNPLDMAKLRIQVQRGNRTSPAFQFNYRNIVHGVSEIARKEGPRGLFKGAGARIAFHAPATAITIALYEECKKLWLGLL